MGINVQDPVIQTLLDDMAEQRDIAMVKYAQVKQQLAAFQKLHGEDGGVIVNVPAEPAQVAPANDTPPA